MGNPRDQASGQGLLPLEWTAAEPARARVIPFRRPPKDGAESQAAEEWFELGCQLEGDAPARAVEAYRRAVASNPALAEAHINLGRLLHARGDARGAEAHYRLALQARPIDATASFNLGIALEDLRRPAEAASAYRDAIGADPRCADAFFNLSRLCERQGLKSEALRLLKSYRSLVGPGGSRAG